jgi:hypothetical protein
MVPSKTESMPALPQSFKEAPAAVEKTEEVAEPVKRTPAKAKAEAPAPKNVSDILSDWATDEDA